MTSDRIELAHRYLAPPPDTFWRWEDEGETATWFDGTTIAFRAEIAAILTQLAPLGLPPLGSLILLLAACRDDWRCRCAGIGILTGVAAYLDPPGTGKDLHGQVKELVLLMERINALPAPLRSGLAPKVRLATAVFEGEDRLSPAESAGIAQALADGLAIRGAPQTDALPPQAKLLRFAGEIQALRSGLSRLSFATLPERLQTSVEVLPGPAPVSLPLPEKTDLLQALLGDQQTAGLATLARRLLAAIRIPPHSSASGDLPVGGLSDITNRGQLDALLLSELANDDLTLSSRLATREALYYRRESPPPKPVEKLVVLLDRGIRLWGAPRVFSIAAALAFALQGRKRAAVASFALDKDQFQPIDLLTPEGIRQQLGPLETAVHPGAALQLFYERQQHQMAGAEAVLVTHRRTFEDPDFTKLWMGMDRRPEFVARVDRDGSFELLNCRGGGSQVEVSAELDLASILRAGDGIRHVLPTGPAAEGLPLACALPLFPLLLPATPLHRHQRSIVEHDSGRSLAIVQDRRLMYWPRDRWGGLELGRLPPASASAVHLGENGLAYAFVLTTTSAKLDRAFLYVANPNAGDHGEFCRRYVLEGAGRSSLFAFFLPGCLVILPKTGHMFRAYSLEDGHFLASASPPGGRVQSENYLTQGRFTLPNHTQLLRVRWNGTSLEVDWEERAAADFKPRGETHAFAHEGPKWNFVAIGLSADGCVTMISARSRTPWTLRLHEGNLCWVLTRAGRLDPACQQPSQLAKCKKQGWRFREARLGETGTALVDCRGVLHLKSAKPQIPEVAVVIREGQTSAWASNGKRCGLEMHHGSEPRCSAQAFYPNIQAILDSTR